MRLRNLAHITHLIYFFTGTAAGTLNGHEPTAAYQGSSRVLLSIPISEHLGGEDSGAATQNAIYRISLLIITHVPVMIKVDLSNECVYE